MKLQTVTGSVPVEDIGLIDGHAHLWIDPPEDIAPEARLQLDNYEAIQAELVDFCAAGGTGIVDCQPGGCGRDAAMLVRLAETTGLHVTATTGFHQQKYYPPNHWLWSASVEKAAAYFTEELTVGMHETGGTVRATTIKVGYEGMIDGQSRVLMEAAAEAARHTGAAILFHTERGNNVEKLPPFFADRGVPTERLYICHVDKRTDVGLHRELAQAGALLGYDTFVRPKYNPDQGAWQLLHVLVDEGLGGHIALGLDLAIASMWQHYGGQPGMLALPEQIVPRLRTEGIPEAVIAQLSGQNVARHLVWRKFA
jgi:predicted metal-dependent phosphotriesterase family hydrolase